MKKCAYCGEILGSLFHFKTDEHIIPDGLKQKKLLHLTMH